MKNYSTQNEKYKYLWTLISLYVMITLCSDLYESKIITLLWLHAGAGILLFSLTYILIEIITEVYGYKKGRQAIWIGIIFCALFIIFAKVITLFITASHLSPIDQVILTTARIFVSTIATVVIAEHINAYIVAKLKIIFKGQYTGIRFVFSTFVATGVSMMIFCLFAFYGRITDKGFILLSLTSWLYRFITEIFLIPFSVMAANKLKQIERTDIYDTQTNYNIFKFDDQYDMTQNHYKLEKQKEIL